jgi:hypothetical protein
MSHFISDKSLVTNTYFYDSGSWGKGWSSNWLTLNISIYEIMNVAFFFDKSLVTNTYLYVSGNRGKGWSSIWLTYCKVGKITSAAAEAFRGYSLHRREHCVALAD